MRRTMMRRMMRVGRRQVTMDIYTPCKYKPENDYRIKLEYGQANSKTKSNQSIGNKRHGLKFAVPCAAKNCYWER